jgi:alanine racemase
MGAIIPENIARLKLHNFAFVVQDAAAIQAFGRRKAKVKLHLDINTGMNRYGIAPADVTELIALIKTFPNLTLEGVMTHLADSDGLNPATVDKAVDIFDQAVDTIRSLGLKPTIIHVAQSAGSLKARSRHATAMRLGVSLYGINPLDPADPLYTKLSALKPALTLTSTITRIHELKAGDQVSYNYTFTAQQPMRLGVLPLGYYEGVPRALSNVGAVTHQNASLPILGRVCMNHTMIGLAGTDAKVGDTVVIISSDPQAPNSVASIDRDNHLFSYQFLTSLSHDLRRRLVA